MVGRPARKELPEYRCDVMASGAAGDDGDEDAAASWQGEWSRRLQELDVGSGVHVTGMAQIVAQRDTAEVQPGKYIAFRSFVAARAKHYFKTWWGAFGCGSWRGRGVGLIPWAGQAMSTGVSANDLEEDFKNDARSTSIIGKPT